MSKILSENTFNGAGLNFPKGLTNVLSLLKIINGCALIALGVLSLIVKATFATSGSGIWNGILVFICGLLGLLTVKTNASCPCVLSFLIFSLLCLCGSGTIIVFATLGLTYDTGYPNGYVKDFSTGERIPVSRMSLKEGSMMINVLLIIFGALDILLAIPCFIIGLRTMFQTLCYKKNYKIEDKKYLLTSWNRYPPPSFFITKCCPNQSFAPSCHPYDYRSSSSSSKSSYFQNPLNSRAMMSPSLPIVATSSQFYVSNSSTQEIPGNKTATTEEYDFVITGLDRELAEEYIDQTLVVNKEKKPNKQESEAW